MIRTLLQAALPLCCALVLAAHPAPGDSAFERAWALAEAGQPSAEAFQAVLDDAAQPVKDRFNAAYALCVQSLARGEAERALALCARADLLLAARPQVALRRCDALVQLAKLEQAQAVLEGVRLAPGASAALRRLRALSEARLRHAKGESDVAIELLVRLTEQDPKDWEPFYLMGLVYESFDLPAEALAAYERVIANDPGRDPFAGIYAYQRWAALTISTEPGSYDDKPRKEAALARYRRFLERAQANAVAESLTEQVRQAVSVLETFGA